MDKLSKQNLQIISARMFARKREITKTISRLRKLLRKIAARILVSVTESMIAILKYGFLTVLKKTVLKKRKYGIDITPRNIAIVR